MFYLEVSFVNFNFIEKRKPKPFPVNKSSASTWSRLQGGHLINKQKGIYGTGTADPKGHPKCVYIVENPRMATLFTVPRYCA